jgi:hypothetical protein
MRELVAELCHSQWSGWMDYLFSKCTINPDGSMNIPVWAVERWKHQAESSYQDLSEQEKNSDREEADKFLKLFAENDFMQVNMKPDVQKYHFELKL